MTNHGPVPACSACGSSTLSPLGDLTRAGLQMTRESSGFFDVGAVVLSVRARVCGQCGHVMLFLPAPDLEQLRAAWSVLKDPP